MLFVLSPKNVIAASVMLTLLVVIGLSYWTCSQMDVCDSNPYPGVVIVCLLIGALVYCGCNYLIKYFSPTHDLLKLVQLQETIRKPPLLISIKMTLLDQHLLSPLLSPEKQKIMVTVESAHQDKKLISLLHSVDKYQGDEAIFPLGLANATITTYHKKIIDYQKKINFIITKWKSNTTDFLVQDCMQEWNDTKRMLEQEVALITYGLQCLHNHPEFHQQYQSYQVWLGQEYAQKALTQAEAARRSADSAEMWSFLNYMLK